MTTSLFEPFEGVRYASPKLGPVLCPPYDIIGAELAKTLRRGRANAVHIELPVGDYAKARALFAEWLASGVLERDQVASYYAVEQTFDHGRRKRLGVLGALRLEKPGGAVIPHERTFSKPRQERMRLLKALRINTSPVFGCYSDPDKTVAGIVAKAGAPVGEGPGPQGSRYRLYRVSDLASVAAIRAAVSKSKVLIADGHHRYRVALEFGQRSKLPQGDRTLAYLCADDDMGLAVLPTHRVLPEAAVPWPKLARLCDVEPRKSLSDLESSLGGIQFGVVRKEGGKLAFYFCDPKPQHRRVLGKMPTLDVEWVQRKFLKKAEVAAYVHETKDAVERVKKGKGLVAVILGSLSVPRIRWAVESNGLLPQKSTYFYPKIATGLVFRSLE